MERLQNMMETIVKDYVNQHIAAYDVCDCDSCKLDVMAIILNKLPTHYVVSSTGELYAKAKAADFQPNVDLMVAMTEAIEAVKSRPKHNRPERKTGE
jgi:competence protein ComFB